MFAPSIPAGHFMSVGNRVESSWVTGRLGTVTRDLGDRYVLVDWDDLDVDTVCNEDDLEPAPPAADSAPAATDLAILGAAGLRVCGASTWDGNRDDPSYAYCGLSPAHAGQHRFEI